MNVAIPLIVIAIMVAFNALYVAAEFATVGLRRSPRGLGSVERAEFVQQLR